MARMTSRPFDERVQGINRHIDDGLGGADLRQMITNFANYYGKDALLAVILEWLGLSRRSGFERVAELVFGLVPGRIQRVLETENNELVLCDGSFKAIRLRLEDHVLAASMAWDEETGTLAVKPKRGGG